METFEFHPESIKWLKKRFDLVLAVFPNLIQRIYINQIRQEQEMSLEPFVKFPLVADSQHGGFDWKDSLEGYDFWNRFFDYSIWNESQDECFLTNLFNDLIVINSHDYSIPEPEKDMMHHSFNGWLISNSKPEKSKILEAVQAIKSEIKSWKTQDTPITHH